MYKLLLKSSQSFPSSFLCQVYSNKTLSILSICHFYFPVTTYVRNNHSSSTACYQTVVSSCNASVNKIKLFHRKFGHPYHDILMQLLKNDQSANLSTSFIKQAAQQICEACQMGKIHRLHFLVIETKTSQVLELIHTDLWGPSPILSRVGYVYYISFVDDFSRYTWIYPLKLKSKALQVSNYSQC